MTLIQWQSNCYYSCPEGTNRTSPALTSPTWDSHPCPLAIGFGVLSLPVQALLWVCLFASLPPAGCWGSALALYLPSAPVPDVCCSLSLIRPSEWTLHSCCVLLATPELSQSLSFLFLGCPWLWCHLPALPTVLGMVPPQ